MANSPGAKSKRRGRSGVVVPAAQDAKHVRRAFEEDAKHPERRSALTPEQIRRWAETGQWPESSD